MLGATYHKIFDAISDLKYIEGLEHTYSMLYDNFEYMKRLINSIDDDFSTQKMNFEEVPVNEFLQKYCCAWQNYGKKQFSVDFTSEINNNTTFKVDEVFMKVLLDAVLENANRHGFNGIEVEDPQILISASYTNLNKMPFVLISIANNGASFPEGFTIEEYVREGEFGGTKGNTGRGGFHTYQITKRHQGYICINSDEKWNVKINIMIPIEYYDESETEKFFEYGEEKYM
jgi:signal transduction histidine kinase